MARLLLSAAAAEESHFPCFIDNCTASSVCWHFSCIPSPNPFPIFPFDPPPADSVSVGISHKQRLIQSFLIVAASLLAFSFFSLLVFYFLLLRRRRRHRLQQLALHQNHPPPPLDPNPANDLLHEDDGPHHIWYIRTVGLDDSVIKSIAATVYKAGDGLIDCGDCSVCLGEFREGETIKLLPKCTHAFHLSCIDTWLRSHVNCPLCRAPVVAPPPPPTAASSAEVGGSLHSQENAQIEISQRETQEECVIAINSAAAESSSSRQLDGDEDGEVQPIRRSVSMDSSSLGVLLLRADSESDAEEKLGEEKREIDVEGVVGTRKIKGKGVVECLRKQQKGVEMKRSMSSMSGRLFLSRYNRGRGRGRGRGRSASVLPL